MSTDSGVKITPEVRSDDRIMFLIRVNKEELAFVDTEREAILVIDSLAASETVRMTDDWTKVYREDLRGGREVVLSTQSLGRVINGSIVHAETIDCIPVGHVFLVRGRHERVEESDLNETPSVPLPEFLEKMAKIKGESEKVEDVVGEKVEQTEVVEEKAASEEDVIQTE